jgi:hypothetical protein
MKPIQRRISKEVRVGSLVLGGNNPIPGTVDDDHRYARRRGDRPTDQKA